MLVAWPEQGRVMAASPPAGGREELIDPLTVMYRGSKGIYPWAIGAPFGRVLRPEAEESCAFLLQECSSTLRPSL